MKIEKLKIDDIKPYWRNPRKNADAVDTIKKSISRYGYNSPILVDKENIIIAGHTRFMALRELQKEEVEVIRLDLDEEKAKEFRIVDNKSTEFAMWDNEKLMQELREISDIDQIKDYFPNDDLIEKIANNINYEPIQYTDESFNNSFSNQPDNFENNEDTLHKVMCPHCLKEHYINKSELNNFASDVREE
jgi:hypothetical protein